ncbi:flagellar protein FlaG [Alteribacillus persepolensis]|uniref:Flagellar protein FlaG n=1 Tax=Alteribacillus persepolensis TaxID=568899 RepID=A0A1G8AG74_9BACI|nr:flagellar protein FlaG [Alteribacillus persepolensis]SDH19877.1 flagellar protein FlaG [Alteribacillus persepolensis]
MGFSISVDASYAAVAGISSDGNGKDRSMAGSVKHMHQQDAAVFDRKALQQQINEINDRLEASFVDLKFQVHEELDRVYVQVLERESEEVIREVPPKQFLDIAAAMLQQVGMLVDETI